MSEHGVAADAPPGTSVTLERETEIEQLRALLEIATVGRGRLIVVEGPAGIGKSRLLDEARSMAQERRFRILRARGDELERANPFGVVSSLLEPWFIRAGAHERADLLRGRAALAAPLLSGVERDAKPAAATDEFALLHGLYWAIVNLAEQQPLAVMIDDVQWADDLSLRFLIYLAQRAEDLPVALFVVIRSGDPQASSELVSRLSMATVEPPVRPMELSVDAVRALLSRSEAELSRSEPFVQASWQATRGNPFLINELVAAMRQEEAAGRSLDAGDLASFAPQSVGRTVVIRLGRLGPDAMSLARACAVLGNEAPLVQAATLANLDGAAAAAAAERLLAAQIVETPDPLSFAHPMIRSAVYAGLPPGERPRAHLRAAQMLHELDADPAEVAHHLVSGVPSHDQWARDALHEAGRVTARKGSPARALQYLRRAADLRGPDDNAGPLLVDLGIVEAAAGQTTSLERFQTALRMIDEPAERARALYALGQTLYRYGEAARAAETFQRGAELFMASDSELALKFEAAVMCCAMQVMPIRHQAMERLEVLVRAVPPDRPPTTDERALLAVHSCNLALGTAPGSRAAELARMSLGDGELLRAQTSESIAVNLAMIALILSGQPAEAQAHADAVLAQARDSGTALAFAEASMVRAMAMLARGRINEAMADAQAAIDGVTRGWQALIPVPQATVVRCHVERGELAAADTVLREVEPLLPDADARGLNAQYFGARGGLRLARGEPKAALDDLLLTGEILKSYGYVNPAAVPWRTPAALAYHAMGDDAQAHSLLDEELALARAFGLPASIGAALRVRAIVMDHDVQTLREAVAVLEEVDAPLELARALVDLGGAHRRAGRRMASREPLRRALALAHQCGAWALERSARDELLATGARPRRAMLTGIEALTPSERRIAELVASGQTNRAVAETLFVTKGTIEWHLKHIFQKLDVRSREQLAGRLASDAEPVE